MAETGSRNDPYRAYNFKLDIQGITEGHFTECTGLNARVHTLTYHEAGSTTKRKLPGPVEFGDITLRYGVTPSKQLWDWFFETVNGKLTRKNLSIVLLANDGVTSAMQWNLTDAWISSWNGPNFNAGGQEVAIESITLTYESLARA